MGDNRIMQTSPDKVRGKKVKYKRGDLLSIKTTDNKYLAAFISSKFNKYYDVVLTSYLSYMKPVIDNFINGMFFGTRFGSLEEITYAVHIEMMECKYVDGAKEIELVGNLVLKDEIVNDGQSYKNDAEDLYTFYREDLPIRMLKTANAEKFPEIGFVSKHLISMKNIISV